MQSDVRYEDKVTVLVAVKKRLADTFKTELVDYMQGRVSIEDGNEYYAPFFVEKS